MNVFISWSGELSGAVAELLAAWLPDVIQRVKPWLSREDIDKGSIWSNELNEALSTTLGILCVTQENKNAPWLLFEAGALSKGLTKVRVCPLLIDLHREDVQLPLSIFNLTLADNVEMLKLVKSINSADPENKLPDDRLKKAFDQHWPDFDRQFKTAREKYRTTTKARKRTGDEMIVEVLEITRAIQRAMERAESKEQFAFSPLSGVTPPLGAGVALENPFPKYTYVGSSPGTGKTEVFAFLQMLDQLKKAAESKKAAEDKPVKEGDTPSES